MLTRIFLPVLILLLTCCSGESKSPNIFYFSQLKKKQYLLTNDISVKNRELASGASAYLIEHDGSIYFVTARHLTTDAMGFVPALDLNTYPDSINFWNGYPRTGALSEEIIATPKELLYSKDDMDDLVLFKLKNKPREIGVFKPDFTLLETGDRVSVIGCEYADSDCNQKQFFGTFQQYGDNLIEVVMDSTNIQIAGMSGAPVVNDQFEVIGHLIAGGISEQKNMVVYITPIDLIKKIIP